MPTRTSQRQRRLGRRPARPVYVKDPAPVAVPAAVEKVWLALITERERLGRWPTAVEVPDLAGAPGAVVVGPPGEPHNVVMASDPAAAAALAAKERAFWSEFHRLRGGR